MPTVAWIQKRNFKYMYYLRSSEKTTFGPLLDHFWTTELDHGATYPLLPVKVPFTTPVKKCQRKLLNRVLIDLRLPFFAHTQMYVALSPQRNLFSSSTLQRPKDCLFPDISLQTLYLLRKICPPLHPILDFFLLFRSLYHIESV